VKTKRPAPSIATDPLAQTPADTTITTLNNGLVVILREDHSAPVVSAQAWCRTGSIHEGPWLGAGLSHVLEHMLFKGTERRGPGRIDQEIHEAGGYLNAYTSFDRTVYWINVPTAGAHVAIDVLADIMQHATLPDDELARELDVIRREMDMNHDDPGRRSSRRLFESAYTQSPYRFTVIGYPDIFNELRPADIRTYYRQRYVPNNIFFVVVGDVHTDQILEQLQAAFTHAKTKALPPFVLPAEPTQVAFREVIEEAPIELGHFHGSWHIPDLRHHDVPALDVLATLLGSGRSSRLFQSVRERQRLVHSVDAWTYSPGNPGLFGVSAVTDAHQFQPSTTAILTEVRRLQERLIPAPEYRKAVKQFVAGTLATRKTMQGQAQDLGANWLTTGDLQFSNRYLQSVRALHPAQLRDAARKYLTRDNLTLFALLPKGTTPRRTQSAPARADQPILKFIAPNGLRLLVKSDSRLPFVEFRALFQGGVLAETPEDNGLSQLTARLLLKGSRKRDAQSIANAIESVGGSIDNYSGNHSLGISLEVLHDDFRTGLDVLADLLLHPVFPKNEFEREQQIQQAIIKAQRDQPLKCAGINLRRALFGPHGYGLDSSGTESSVARLNTQSLRAFHRHTVVPPNCVLAIFGAVDPVATRTAVDRAFARWSHHHRPLPDGAHTPASAPPQKRTDAHHDKKQAVIMLGFPGATLTHPNRFALELIQEACSDLGSRLFLRIREHLGLAYYVGAQNFLGIVPGYFAFYAGTSPENAERVEHELLQEAALLASDGLSDDELRRAKAKILGQKKIGRQDLGNLAMSTALDELYGLGFDFSDQEDQLFEAVTADQIRSVARQYLQPSAAVISVIRPNLA
jgi:zinc protease